MYACATAAVSTPQLRCRRTAAGAPGVTAGAGAGVGGGAGVEAGVPRAAVPAVLAPWRAYLADRPDSLHPSAHWSVAEQRALPPGAEYDLTRGFLFPGRHWARGTRLTVLDVAPAERDSSAWQVRTLFATVHPDSAVRTVGVVRTRVVREGGRWVLASPVAAATRGWTRARAGRIAYVSAPGRRFDPARAARAARVVDSLAAADGGAPPATVA